MKNLIQIDIPTYLRQYVVPLVSSLIMVLAITGIKYFINNNFVITNTFLLITCTVVGVIVYPLSIRLIDPDLFQKLMKIIDSGLLKFNKV
jgi:PST family polysaccharide transporter